MSHINPDTLPVELTAFQTILNWNERADLRNILKKASQSAFSSYDERALAMRLLGELDQLELTF